jgi:hypothetical protein
VASGEPIQFLSDWAGERTQLTPQIIDRSLYKASGTGLRRVVRQPTAAQIYRSLYPFP